jgi:transposase
MAQRKFFKAQRDENDGRISVGNGYAIEWVSNKHLVVYRYGVPYKKTEIRAAIDRRRLVVELVLEGGVTKSILAEALDVSRQSIDTWIETFKNAGFEGLVNSYKGGRESGRKENSEKLPRGNKARQLEEGRRRKREALEKRQLIINFESKQSGNEKKQADVFNESHEFQESRYAGGFLYWGIFQHVFDFMGLCESYLGRYAVIIYLFAMMLVHDIGSVEQLKTVFKREFGRLIGVKQLFSKPIIWKMIHGACALQASKSFIEAFFKRQAINGLVALYWLYIDGHFIPYYGEERIHKGFYTQRDQMMPGQTEMFVHDCHGQIVYFEIQEGKGDIKEMMRRMSDKWSSYIGDIAPLIIVDREVWGVEHFISMDGYRFVTWEKHSKPEEINSIPDKDFGDVFDVNEKGYQAYEDKKEYKDNKGNGIELRRIVIWNKTTGRRVVCVAQDEKEETITLARAMLGRWGCSENSFKHMGDRLNMHYNPVVDASKESENQDILNPEYKRLKAELSQLKKKLTKCERKLGQLPITINKDGSVRKSKKREKLLKEQATIQGTISGLEKKLKDCPEKVTLDYVRPGESFKVLETEGKNLWDLAETLVWNSRKKLIRMFKEFLPNPRDLIPALDAITSCRGWVKSTRETIQVRLEPLETPRYHAAQIQLCRTLNEKKIRLSNGKRIFYDVGHAPNSVQKIGR